MTILHGAGGDIYVDFVCGDNPYGGPYELGASGTSFSFTESTWSASGTYDRASDTWTGSFTGLRCGASFTATRSP